MRHVLCKINRGIQKTKRNYTITQWYYAILDRRYSELSVINTITFNIVQTFELQTLKFGLIYFIYVQFKQTNIINTEIINTNTKLIQIQNFKLELLLQSVYNCTWIWSKVKKNLSRTISKNLHQIMWSNRRKESLVIISMS